MSDFSIDSILSNKADRYASSHFPWPYHPLLLHSANSFVHSHHSFGYVGLHSAPGSAAVTGNMTCEDFRFGHGERSCWSNWAHQPQPHCCPGQTVVGILGPAAMGQMGLQFLTQNGKRRRRHRTVFTEQQLEDLENLFNASSYPDSGTREKLAWKTHLSEETIKVWFKNRRAKSRKQKMPLQGKLNSSSTCDATEEAGKHSVHPSVAS